MNAECDDFGEFDVDGFGIAGPGFKGIPIEGEKNNRTTLTQFRFTFTVCEAAGANRGASCSEGVQAAVASAGIPDSEKPSAF
jgi:hypothetical protein